MRRFEELKRLDKKTRNRLRAILSNGENNAISGLMKLQGKLGKDQSKALESILTSPVHVKAVKTSTAFPKFPPFSDTLQSYREMELNEILNLIESGIENNVEKIFRLVDYIHQIDIAYAENDSEKCIGIIEDALEDCGWSHALLRRIVLIRENSGNVGPDDKIENLVTQAGIKLISVASVIHAYACDQNIITIKRSILNIADRGSINRYSRAISKIVVQPFSSSAKDLADFLSEVERCSLIDAIIIAKFNSHLFPIDNYPFLSKIAARMGRVELFENIVKTFDENDSDSEYNFFKQSTAWLEYEPIRRYRILVDNYYDASREEEVNLPSEIQSDLKCWVNGITLQELVGNVQFTNHDYTALAKLELSGNTTRSALFNYWLSESAGEIGFEKENLLSLMGVTRDLARTVPIKAIRTAAKLASDELVKLILLLLLAKRSKNELDSFLLKRLLAEIAKKFHGSSLLDLVRSYEKLHPYVAEYIYEIATEDFLAKLSKLAPHLSDIPETRASLHEWMAGFSNDEHFLQRARAVRIDHQINRVRNEIDDHRLYVDPSRFASWFEDEMMLELNNALSSTGSGKKGVSVTCDETVLSLIMTQSYNAFCSNPVFGISSYLGRRIRHGTFHGHLYSNVINKIEENEKYKVLFSNAQFAVKWQSWKDVYNNSVEKIISERLHVYSKSKPLGLLTPEIYSQAKNDVRAAAVKSISNNFAETTSTVGIDQMVIDYCWRLAELDLVVVNRYLKAQQQPLKNERFLNDEVVPAAASIDLRIADSFRRELELSIDRKLSAMFGWFKRPSIVAPKASVSMLFAATVAEVRDTIPDFDPGAGDSSKDEIELVGGFYHLIYDSLAIVVGNAAKHADRNRPLHRNFGILPGKGKRLVVEIISAIKPNDDPAKVSSEIQTRKLANFEDANMYDSKSGISKLLLLANNRSDFELDQYEVVGNEVHVRLIYALDH